MDVPWRLPLMQAPIGPATTPELVIAVARVGALGTLAAAWTEPEVLRDQIREVKSAIDVPFCVNLALAFDQEERLEVVVREGVPCVSFSWGLDEDMIERTHRAGASALVQVGSDAEATRAVAAGADVIIAQGTEAGGHVQSTVPLHRLLSRPPRGSWAADRRGGRDRRVRGRPRRPDCRCRRRRVWDGPSRGPRGGCPPALPGAPHRCRARGTLLTELFDVGWPNAPHRVLRHETVSRWENGGKAMPGLRPGEHEVVASREGRPVVRYSDAQPTRGTTGDVEAMATYAGRSVFGIKRSEPAASIVLGIALGAT